VKLGYWILDENDQMIQVDLMTWAMWIETGRNRVIKQETFGDYQVSTVFLGLDHNFSHQGPPVLWETIAFIATEPKMVLGRLLTRKPKYIERCAGNKEQAEAMHERMVERIKKESQKMAPT
jgi:hypothetical protein